MRALMTFAAVVAAMVGAQVSQAQYLDPYGSQTPAGSAAVGGFNDTYPFRFNVASGIVYIISPANDRSSFPIGELTAQLFSGNTPTPWDRDGIPITSQVPGSIVAGALGPRSSLPEIGDNTTWKSSFDNYGTPLGLMPPIAASPQPSIWAMMLVVITLVAIRLRRKSRLAGARRFT